MEHSNQSKIISDNEPKKWTRIMAESQRWTENLQLRNLLKEHSSCVNSVAWSESGDLLVAGGDDRVLCVWRYPEFRPVQHIQSMHSTNIFTTSILPSQDNRILVSGSLDSNIHIFENLQGCGFRLRQRIQCHSSKVQSLAANSNAPGVFFSASDDGSVKQFDLREPIHICNHESTCLHKDAIRKEGFSFHSLSWSRYDDRLLLTGGSDSTARIYDLRYLREPKYQTEAPMFFYSQGPMFADENQIYGVRFNDLNPGEFCVSHHANPIGIANYFTSDGGVCSYQGHLSGHLNQKVRAFPILESRQ